MVAPIQCSSPLAKAGFKRFEASRAPSVFPAPTRVCISSMNRIISPDEDSTSDNIDFNLSSNSPLNFAPAIKEPISSDNNFFCNKGSGTSPLTILKDNPSAIAVLPTPGWPIKTGLFLVLLLKTWIALLISSSLPIIGSILPSRASLQKSVVNFSNA